MKTLIHPCFPAEEQKGLFWVCFLSFIDIFVSFSSRNTQREDWTTGSKLPHPACIQVSSHHGPGIVNSLRNCSCADAVSDCNEAMANLVCRCHTVERSALLPGGLRWNHIAEGGPSLSIWVREPWVVSSLLNGSEVPDLRLSLCAPIPLSASSHPLTLFGLRSLELRRFVQGQPFLDQAIYIGPDLDQQAAKTNFSSLGLRVTFLDVSALNGTSSLKAYSVSGPPAHTLAHHFPHLTLLLSAHTHTQHMDTITMNSQQPCLLTFIY
ncbi:uncharacterized protein C21orf62-like isoform X2 [Denticeps clupeoides]|uniref:uncharacterized protein C21orf62-like isoform X2 n=1 Tax=Denticeps clupeoides TaxID=299321 RepID=UPI0010A57C3A|nr:uncharacterized protein C21orf62 homolog isoform X2 [Denticeps clupeoides]